MNLINEILKKILFKINSKIKRHPLQKPYSTKKGGIQFVRLGSKNGGWTFCENKNLYNSTIISAGLGEDASFDVEFTEKYNSKIIIIDPTPRAITHYKEIIKNIGKKKTKNYRNSGHQDIDSYNLTKLKKKKFILEEKALWICKKKVKFFKPSNNNYVSHSINNFQNNYNINSDYIMVNSISLTEIIKKYKLSNKGFPLMKLDIEGAEIEVLIDCIKKKIRPNQILVEYDELNNFTKNGHYRVTKTHNLLCKNNYKLVFSDGTSNFLYLKK